MKAHYRFPLNFSFSIKIQCLLLTLTSALLPSCTFLSNRDHVKTYSSFQGIQRIAIFLQRWPVYRQKPDRNDLGEDFIKNKTYFYGSWQPAAQINPRAVDLQDIDDSLVRETLIKVLEGKGYQVILGDVLPGAAESLTADALMAQCQAVNPQVDAFLFLYYAPTLFMSQARATPRDHAGKSYSLQEIIHLLGPGTDAVIWVGNRSQGSPVNSMSHAFIYLSMTLFKARDWQMLLEVADSQAGGKVRPWIPQCPPGPTDHDYFADAGIIQRLMLQNLRCRLGRLIPEAF